MAFRRPDRRRLYQRRIHRKRRFIGRGILSLAVIGIIFLVTNKACQTPPEVTTNNHSEVLKKDPSNVEAYYNLAETHYHKAIKLDKEGEGLDSFNQAIKFYQRGLALDKEETISSLNYYHLGMSYFKISKYFISKDYYQQAKLAFNKALEKGFANIDIYIYLGHIAFKENNLEAAKEYYLKATEINPKDFAAWFNLGWTYKTMGLPNKALEALRQVSQTEEIDKNLKMRVHTILADIYEEQELIEHAKDEYKKMLKINRNSEKAHYRLGMIYKQQGNLEMAEEELKQALKINPANKDVQLELSRISTKE